MLDARFHDKPTPSVPRSEFVFDPIFNFVIGATCAGKLIHIVLCVYDLNYMCMYICHYN